MRWWLEMHLNEAHAKAHKWGMQAQLSNTFKAWKIGEYGTSMRT